MLNYIPEGIAGLTICRKKTKNNKLGCRTIPHGRQTHWNKAKDVAPQTLNWRHQTSLGHPPSKNEDFHVKNNL